MNDVPLVRLEQTVHVIEESGKLLRRSGGKSPASWQEKSVLVAKLIRFMQKILAVMS